MLNSSTSSYIEMPLFIGCDELNSHNKDSITINSAQLQINLILRNDISLKKFIRSKNQNDLFLCDYRVMSEKQIQIMKENSQDLLELSDALSHKQFRFPIYKQLTNNSKQSNSFNFSFNILLSSHSENKKYHLDIVQENILFQLVKISSNVKFVRNNILIDLLNLNSNPKQGLLTMDQSNRFLFQSSYMTFPAIGFWIKTQKSLTNIQLYHHLSLFIREKYERKCLFKLRSNQKKYFYFVKLSQHGKKMETFAVSWKVSEDLKKQFIIQNTVEFINLDWNSQKWNEKNQQSTGIKGGINKQTQASSQNSSQSNRSQQNGMDFTLREYKQNQHSTLQSLINYSYLSPIKQLEDNQRQDNLFSEEYANSPQFSTLTKQNPRNQCQELKAQLRNQQLQIQKLKEVIIRMQSELKIYKNSRMSTNCDTNTKNHKFSPGINSPNINEFTVSSHPNSNITSPQEVKRLRESDLRSNSISRSEFFKNSSNKKTHQFRDLSNPKVNDQFKGEFILLEKDLIGNNLYEQLPRIVEEDARDPWQYMEIIQG